MVGNFTAAVAANRFGLGARPGEIGRMADDPRGALRAQLQGGAPLIHNAALVDTATVLSRADEIRSERREHRREDEAADATSSSGPTANNASVLTETTQRLITMFRGLYTDDAVARMQAAVLSDRSFVERLVQFWSNHFAVSADKVVVLGVAGAF